MAVLTEHGVHLIREGAHARVHGPLGCDAGGSRRRALRDRGNPCEVDAMPQAGQGQPWPLAPTLPPLPPGGLKQVRGD